jgi:hypothetical protein
VQEKKKKKTEWEGGVVDGRAARINSRNCRDKRERERKGKQQKEQKKKKKKLEILIEMK